MKKEKHPITLFCILFCAVILLFLASCEESSPVERDLGERSELAILQTWSPEEKAAAQATATEIKVCQHRYNSFPASYNGGGDKYPDSEYHYKCCQSFGKKSYCDEGPRFEKHGELYEDMVVGEVYRYNGKIYQQVRMKCKDCNWFVGYQYKLIEGDEIS